MKGMKGDNKLFHCEDRDTATATGSGTQAPAVGNFRRGIQHTGTLYVCLTLPRPCFTRPYSSPALWVLLNNENESRKLAAPNAIQT